MHHRGGREAAVVGDAKLGGDETRLAKETDLQALEAHVLAEDLLQFLVDLVAVSGGEEIEMARPGRGGDQQQDGDERAVMVCAGFSSRRQWRARKRVG